MATVNEKMTALANEIRELSGTTDTKSLDEMKVDVDAANTEITEQAELIAQITTALEGKASGVEDIDEEVVEYTSLNDELEDVINSLPAAGGGGGGSVDTCTVTITSDSNIIVTCIATIYQGNEFSSVVIGGTPLTYPSTPVVISNVICGSSVHVVSSYSLGGFTITNCEFTRMGPASGMFKITAPQGGSATIHCYNND